jgi:hypothetical protein
VCHRDPTHPTSPNVDVKAITPEGSLLWLRLDDLRQSVHLWRSRALMPDHKQAWYVVGLLAAKAQSSPQPNALWLAMLGLAALPFPTPEATLCWIRRTSRPAGGCLSA